MDIVLPPRNLRAHRRHWPGIPHAYTADLPRVRETAVGHLKRFGFSRVTRSRCPALVDQFVEAIFAAQGGRPFFHIDGPLPFCWNAPKDWDKSYIRYEWGHLRSRNQNQDAHEIDNICLQSARCNQHVQTSMDIAEVLVWLGGSSVAARVESVLERRWQLFASEEWGKLLAELARYR
ncbi:MAG: hypothetical protein ACJ8FY_04190 [Gemmataceae bacterium]